MNNIDLLSLAYMSVLSEVSDLMNIFTDKKKPRPLPDNAIFKMSYRDGIDPIEYIKDKLKSMGWKEGGIAVAPNGKIFPVWHATDGKLYGVAQKKGYACKRHVSKHITIVRMEEIKKYEEKHGNQ